MQVARTYTVRAGGTLSSTAERFSGNAAGWHWIYAANQSKITNLDLVLIVWQLAIPYAAPNSATAPTARTSASAAQFSEGTPSCRQPEELWPRAGRTPSEAFTTAEIAMAGSRGDQHVADRYGEQAYWQANPDHGSLTTCDPEGTAKAAVIISGDDSTRAPRTTFVPGSYERQC